jgi:hypothetical protein
LFCEQVKRIIQNKRRVITQKNPLVELFPQRECGSTK